MPKIIIVFLLILTSCGYNAEKKNSPKAVKGVIDFTGWDFDKDGPVKLDGQWDLYWGKFIEPKDIITDNVKEKKYYITVPGLWYSATDSQTKKNVSMKKYGGATYVLKLKGISKKTEKSLSLKFKYASTAYKLYFVPSWEKFTKTDKSILKVPLMKNGVISFDKSKHIPQFLPLEEKIPSYAETNYIIIQISNFTYSYGGLFGTIFLGDEKDIILDVKKTNYKTIFLLGIIFIMSIYHFALFSQRKNDKSSLYFALSCAFLIIRELCTGGYFSSIWPEPILFTFELLMQIEYFTLTFSLPLLCSFLYSVFKEDYPLIKVKIVWFLSLLYSVVITITDYKFYSKLIILFQIIMFITGIISLIIIGIATYRRRTGSLTFLLGALFFYLTIINDILAAKQIFFTPTLSTIGLVGFIFSQSFVITKIFANTHKRAEKLNIELTDLNLNLEKKVEQRTKDLEEANEELFQKSLEITIAQDKIKERDRQKSNFLANMSHELRTPLNSINGIAELLRFGIYEKNEELTEKIKNIINSLDDVFQNNKENHELSLMINNLKSVMKFTAEDGNLKRYYFLDIKEKLEKNNFFDSYDVINQQIEEIFDTIDIEEKEMFNAYKRIKDSGDYLLELINGILNISQIEAGKIEVKKSETSLREIIESVIETARSYARTKQKENTIDFHTSIEDSVPGSTMLDNQKTKQVLLNYLSNAIKFTEKGNITLSVQKINGNIRFSVKDSGMGIKEEDKNKIFQEFERTENTRNIEGTGLGLAISKKLIELQGGRVGFDSEFGKGSTFWFEMQC